MHQGQTGFASGLVVGLASSYARHSASGGRIAKSGPVPAEKALEHSVAAATRPQLSFEQFAGGWALDWIVHTADGRSKTGKAALLFSWEESRFQKQRRRESVVLGRGELLVMWFPDGQAPVAEYGTTRCFHDPAVGAWRAWWSSSARGRMYNMTEHRVGDEIVMAGSDLHGRPLRWVFSEVAQDSFHWRSVVAANDGTEWCVMEEFDAHHVAGGAWSL